MILEACKRGNKNFLQRIIDENKGKLNLDPKDGLGNTPLHYAAQGDHPETMELLLKQKANPNLQNQVGDAPLHKAVAKNSIRCIELLCTAGADANLKNKKNLSPLHMARGQDVKNVIKNISAKQKEIEDCDDDDMFADDDSE